MTLHRQHITLSAIGSCVVLAVLAAMVGWLTGHVAWINDDAYFYLFIGEDTRPIRSLGDIVGSQCNYYMMRNGRFVTHCLVQWFCALGGQCLFTVCNMLAWIVLVVQIARAGGINWRQSPLAMLAIAALAFACFRTQFSPPCQINYVWVMAATLLVVNEFFDSRRKPWWQAVLLLLLSLLAGWGQESLSPGIAAGMWLWLLLHRQRATRLQWGIAIMFTVGMLGLCLAPGNFRNFVRLNGGHGGYWITPVNIAWLLRLSYIMLAVIAMLMLRKRLTFIQFITQHGFWLCAMVVMLLFNLVVRVYCNRQLFGIDLAALIITVSLMRRNDLSVEAQRAGAVILALLALLVFTDDCRTVNRRVAIYRDIKQQYDASNDGVVYCDIDHRDVGYDDHDAMYTFNDWSRLQLERKWKSQGSNKPLEWRPVVMRQWKGRRLPSQVVTAADGVLVLVASKHDKQPVPFEVTSVNTIGPLHFSGKRVFSSERFTIDDTHFRALVLYQSGRQQRHTTAKLMVPEVR